MMFTRQYLAQCDTILYIKDGKIAERGSHNTLMQTDGVRQQRLSLLLVFHYYFSKSFSIASFS